jgi:hypothetical protein
VLSGARVESVGYAAEPRGPDSRSIGGDAPPQIPAPLQSPQQTGESKVLDLEDWRTRRPAGERSPRREDHEA